jgi:hypothetical protein
VASILHECLKRYGLQDAVNETELQVRELSVTEATGNRGVSRAVLDAMFPPETTPCVRPASAVSIANSRSLTSCINIR